ncbi:hypothetical protein GCM10027599_26720 [Yimella radicis]
MSNIEPSGTPGFIVARRGPNANDPFAVGDEVDTYELLVPLLPPVDARPTPAARLKDAHSKAALEAPRIKELAKSQKWRVLQRLACDCPASELLVTVYVVPGGERWAYLVPEKLPSAFRRTEAANRPLAFPLHREPNGYPHVDIVSCRRCLTRWAVQLTESEAAMAKCRSPHLGARVVDGQ